MSREKGCQSAKSDSECRFHRKTNGSAPIGLASVINDQATITLKAKAKNADNIGFAMLVEDGLENGQVYVPLGAGATDFGGTKELTLPPGDTARILTTPGLRLAFLAIPCTAPDLHAETKTSALQIAGTTTDGELQPLPSRSIPTGEINVEELAQSACSG